LSSWRAAKDPAFAFVCHPGGQRRIRPLLLFVILEGSEGSGN
jgi:hypothetical protein